MWVSQIKSAILKGNSKTKLNGTYIGPHLAQLNSSVGVLWHLLPPLLLHGHPPLLDVVEDDLEGLLPVVDAGRLARERNESKIKLQ